LSATTIWMVEQFGLAMMFFLWKPVSAERLTSGTTSGTSGSIRNCEVLSITTQPAPAALGAYSAETLAPGENRPMSMPRKSKVARSWTSTVRSSPNETRLPVERSDARATTSSTGNFRSCRICNISLPTLPVAPTTATR